MRRLVVVLVYLLGAASCWPATAVSRSRHPRAEEHRAFVRPAARRRSHGTYDIYKTFYNPFLASKDRTPRAHAAQTVNGHDVPGAIVLRWGRGGRGGWGYRHIKERHGYSSSTDSLIEDTVFQPQHIQESHKKGREHSVTYSRTYVADSRLSGDVCTFYVAENPTPLADHTEKGIITVYDNCATFF